MIPLIILTVSFPTVPMPEVLPDYEADCRAGSVAGSMVIETIRIYNEGEKRWASVDDGQTQSKYEVRPTLMFEEISVGRRGFADQLMSNDRAKGGVVRTLLVRGNLNDQLIDFRIVRRPTRPGGPADNLYGNCRLRTLEKTVSR